MFKSTGASFSAIAFIVAVNAAQAQSITFLTEENPPFNFAQGDSGGASSFLHMVSWLLK